VLSCAHENWTREDPMHRFTVALSISLLAPAAFAAPTNDMATRTELHAIETLTLSDHASADDCSP
jgi:hypothetical protein